MSNPREFSEFRKDPYQLERRRVELLNSFEFGSIGLIEAKLNRFFDSLDEAIGNTPDKRVKVLRSLSYVLDNLEKGGAI